MRFVDGSLSLIAEGPACVNARMPDAVRAA